MLVSRISVIMAFDLRLEDGTKAMDARWRDAEANEKRSRARFAQNAMKPAEVGPEWAKARDLLGDPAAAAAFVSAAMSRFNAPLEAKKTGFAAHIGALNPALRERLEERDLSGSIRVVTTDPVPSGASLLNRTHPLTTTLAEALVEGALDPITLQELGIGRIGAWPTAAVSQKTTVALLRLRMKLTLHGRKERLLLAEEAALVALQNGQIIASGAEAPTLLQAGATHDLDQPARDRFCTNAQAALPALLAGPFAAHARARADELFPKSVLLRSLPL